MMRGACTLLASVALPEGTVALWPHSLRQEDMFLSFFPPLPQVTLRRLLDHNLRSVEAILEDRLRLLALVPDAATGNVGVEVRRCSQPHHRPHPPSLSTNHALLPLSVDAAAAAMQLRAVPLKRMAELARLRGWRFVASLAFEAADLAGPTLRMLWRRATALVSWLLVRLIGQALGLVYQGVRQSMAPREPPPQQQRQQQQERRQQGHQGPPRTGQQRGSSGGGSSGGSSPDGTQGWQDAFGVL